MKRAIIALFIFAVILITVIGSLFYCEAKIDEIVALIDLEISRVTKGQGREGGGADPLGQAQVLWQKSMAVFSSIVPHNKVEAVTIMFDQCMALSRWNDEGDYYTSLFNLKSYVIAVKETDIPNFATIF